MINTKYKEIIVIAIFSTLFFGLFIFTAPTIIPFVMDEGYSLVIATQIMNGKTLYSDIDMIYTPLFYYAQAMALSIYDSIISTRLLMVLFGVLGIIGVYLISSQISAKNRFIAPAMYALYIIPIFNVHLPSVLGNALVIFAALFAMKNKYFISGMLLALCFLTKQNIGIFAMIAFGIFLLIQKRVKYIIWISSGVLVVIIPYAIYLLMSSSLLPFINAVFIFPLKYSGTVYQFSFTEPFTNFSLSLGGIASCILRIIYLTPIVLFGWLLITKKDKNILLLTLISIMNYLQFFPNKDIAHFAWGMAPSFVLFGYQFKRYRKLTSILLLGYVLLAFYGTYYYETLPIGTEPIGIPRAELISQRPEYSGIILNILEKVDDGNIFVFGIEGMWYYLSGKQKPTGQFFMPGFSTEKREQDVIESLQAQDIKYVIINKERVPKGYPKVEQYIHSNYYLDSEFDVWQVYKMI